MRHHLIALTLITAFFTSTVWADVVEDSRQATADILFDMDIENASFKINHDGYVDISFGKSLSQEQYLAAVKRLKNNPAIPGVLAGRGSSDYCPVP